MRRDCVSHFAKVLLLLLSLSLGPCANASTSACAQNRQQSTCEHTPAQRAFVGVYCAPELRSALRKGYRLLKVYESWTFDRSDDTLLRDLIRDFFLVKLKASKLPTDEAERRLHIGNINATYKVELTEGDFEFNGPMRFLAKIALNSMFVRPSATSSSSAYRDISAGAVSCCARN